MMSEKALKDLNILPESERKNESFSNGSFTKPLKNIAENLGESQRENPPRIAEIPVTGNRAANSGPEVAVVEVEYIESEKLNDLEDVEMSLKTILPGLDSKDWLSVCEALNNVRRLSLFHKQVMLELFRGEVILLVVKSLKNPRSAVCKTACMTSSDILKAYGDDTINSLDPLLVQLLLKSSQDKRFVCEAAEGALISMTTWISPALLLPKLQPCLKNRNPRIRAKASMCFSRIVPRLDIEVIKAYGVDKLIEIAVSQLSDKLPESRESARSMLLELQTVYKKCDHLSSNALSEDPEVASWEHFCQSKLSPINAQAVLRVTNIVREGLVLGS